MSSTKSIELRELLELSWTPSRYVLSAFVHGQVSNRVAIELCATGKSCVPREPSQLQQVALTVRVAGGKRVLEGTYAASPAAGKSAAGHVVWVVLTRPDGELLNVLDVTTRGALQDGLVRGAFSTDVEAVLRSDPKEPLHAWAFTGEAFVGPIDVPVK